MQEGLRRILYGQPLRPAAPAGAGAPPPAGAGWDGARAGIEAAAVLYAVDAAQAVDALNTRAAELEAWTLAARVTARFAAAHTASLAAAEPPQDRTRKGLRGGGRSPAASGGDVQGRQQQPQQQQQEAVAAATTGLSPAEARRVLPVVDAWAAATVEATLGEGF